MDLSQEVLNLSNLLDALGKVSSAIQPPVGMSIAKISNARNLFAETVPMFQLLVDGHLGVPADEEDGTRRPQVSAENAAKMKRLGLDTKYCGISNEGELLEMQENEVSRKAFLDLKANNVSVDFTGCQNEAEARAAISVARAKAKGLADARARFGR